MPTVKKTPKVETTEPRVEYPKVQVKKFEPGVEGGMPIKTAMSLLGWTVVQEGADFLFIDTQGNKILCRWNTLNRRFTEPWARAMAQDVLNNHWQFNGETIIVGRYGNILSGQHRLIGFILAEQERLYGKQKIHWQEMHPEPLTLACLLVTGISEAPEVLRTFDNVRPRTLSDILFCDRTVFGTTTADDRTVLCKMVERGIKMLWDRTGTNANAYAPMRTHSESIDFISRHSSIKPAVKHIWDEDKKVNGIGSMIGRGEAAALLYLMAQSASDSEADKYRINMKEGSASEKKLNWERWKKAEVFWSLFSQEFSNEKKEGASSPFYPLRIAFAALVDPENPAAGSTRADRIAIVVKAWNGWVENAFRLEDPFMGVDLKLKLIKNKNGDWVNGEKTPNVGGIDIGKADEKDPVEATTSTVSDSPDGEGEETPAYPGAPTEGDAPTPSDPPPAAIKSGKEKERKEREGRAAMEEISAALAAKREKILAKRNKVGTTEVAAPVEYDLLGLNSEQDAQGTVTEDQPAEAPIMVDTSPVAPPVKKGAPRPIQRKP